MIGQQLSAILTGYLGERWNSCLDGGRRRLVPLVVRRERYLGVVMV